MQDYSPLRCEAYLRNSCDRPADEYARKPSVEETYSLHVGARQHGTEGATKYIGGTQENNDFDAESARLTVERSLAQAASQQQQQHDIGHAHDEQKAPPDRHRVGPSQRADVHTQPHSCHKTFI